MKYSSQVIIDLPVDRVVELFDNPDNIPKWQPGFVSMEHISGEYSQPGSKYLMKYKMGKRDVEMVETLLTHNPPKEISATYEAKGVWNLQKNYFKPQGEGKTLYVSESEFKMKGFMKIMAFLMPGAFKKQSQKYLNLFKEFAEKQG